MNGYIFGKYFMDLASRIKVPAILCFTLLLALIYLAFTTNNTQPVLPRGASPVEGKEYLVITSSDIIPKPSPQDTVSVIEFFSYDCDACYEINPLLQAWKDTQPISVQFEQIPVQDQDTHSLNLARIHYIGHRFKNDMTAFLFKWLYEEKQDLDNADAVKNNFLKEGISLKMYENAMYCQAGLEAQIARSAQLEKLYQIDYIPVFIIGGRYKTSHIMTGGNLFRLFEVMEALIEKVRKGEH
jgi:thiol:disulfide interchange protein DsbA